MDMGVDLPDICEVWCQLVRRGTWDRAVYVRGERRTVEVTVRNLLDLAQLAELVCRM